MVKAHHVVADGRLSHASLVLGPPRVDLASITGWPGPPCSTMPPLNPRQSGLGRRAWTTGVGDDVVVVHVGHGATLVAVDPLGQGPDG